MTLTAKELKRLFREADGTMLEGAQTVHDLLLTDLPDFTAKFPWFDNTFVTGFQTDITTGLMFARDTITVADIRVLTEDVNAKVAEGMRVLDALDLYARAAYPDSLGKQRAFGQNDWNKARNNQKEMFFALEHAHAEANSATYKTDLLNKGYSQPDIDNLDTVAQNLLLKNGLQELAKKNRPVTTEHRIQVLNIVWGRKRTVNNCARLVYRDDFAKLDQYRLYPPGTEVETVVIFDITGPTVSPVKDAAVRLLNTSLDIRLSTSTGEVVFKSHHMPDALNIEVDHPLFKRKTVTGYNITIGDTNNIALQLEPL